MAQFDLQTEHFQFEDPSTIDAFLTETSCPSSVASSRRSSEISFSSSVSDFTASPISAVPCFEDLAPNSNLTANFPSARLQYFENEVASLDLSDPIRPDQCMIPAAISYASLNINGRIIPYEYSESGLDFYQDDATDVNVGSGQLIPYRNDIGLVIPDESVMPYLHPPFIIPSQTLKNHIAQNDSITDPSRAKSSEDPHNPIFESRYETEDTVVPVGYKPSDRIVRSEIVRPRSSQKSHRMRNHSAGGRSLEQSLDTQVTLRVLKPTKATRNKKFKCSWCAKGFDRQEHYKRHQFSESHRKKIEGSKKPVEEPLVKFYPCRACDKTFNRHDNLKPHIRTHLFSEIKSSRNVQVTIEQSWEYGWEELDPRIPSDDVVRGRRERSRRVAGG